MAIFNSYVKLPEGNHFEFHEDIRKNLHNSSGFPCVASKFPGFIWGSQRMSPWTEVPPDDETWPWRRGVSTPGSYRPAVTWSPWKFRFENHWIGLRENLQETIVVSIWWKSSVGNCPLPCLIVAGYRKMFFFFFKSGYNNSEPGAKRLNIMNIISAELDEDAQIGSWTQSLEKSIKLKPIKPTNIFGEYQGWMCRNFDSLTVIMGILWGTMGNPPVLLPVACEVTRWCPSEGDPATSSAHLLWNLWNPGQKRYISIDMSM